MRYATNFMGADTPGWAAPAHSTPGVWDHLKAAASGIASTGGDTLKNVAPVVTSYWNAQAARANARAAASNLLPKSITDKGTLTAIGGPIAMGVGVLAVVLLVGSMRGKRRR
jgi:hypothetical protein